MPISGPVVHRQLMDGYTAAQANLDAARAKVGDTKSQRDDLDDSRGEALVDLAEHYLPELTRDAIRSTWVEIRGTVSQILLRKEDHRRKLRESLDRMNLNREHEDNKLVTFNEQLDVATEAEQEVASEVEQKLSADPEFVSLSDRAAVAEVALERNEANLAEIEQDAAKKLPDFDNSKLFRYLYDQGYGTSEYTERGFTKRMDRSLAKFIDYAKSKQSYDFLKDTPTTMRKIIAQDREAFDVVMTDLERRRDEVAADFGLPDKIAAAETLRQERAKQLAVLEKLQQETEGVDHELTELEGTRGPYYNEAVTVFREMLERADPRDLEERARETREISDDQIVANLIGVESKIDQLEETTQRKRQDLLELQDAIDTLGRLIQRFRSAGFDSSRSQFVASLDVVEELHRARTSRDIEELGEKIRNAQRWGPTAMEKIEKVATHPLTQVLINAMAHAAGGALQGHARRAGRRRYRSRRW